MSQIKLIVMTCDRCERVEEMRAEGQIYAWGEIFASEVNGSFLIGDRRDRKTYDLCPGCVSTLQRWWKQGTEILP